MGRYIDTLPSSLEEENPTRLITYAVEVLNTSERSAGLSNQVPVPAAPTLPPPRDFTAQVTAEGILLKWTEPEEGRQASEISHRYRIYRREESSASGTLIAELPPDQMLQTHFLDHSFEWEKTYYYHVTPVTLVTLPGEAPLAVEGDDTSSLKIWAHDIYPPAVPSALQAVFSGVGQQPFIDLTWAPDSDADLAGYNVYRREPGGAPGKLNSQLVKTPAYRDTGVVSGKKYVYSVSALDLRGNESARSEEASESVP
jgi:fibronectin type 3 domain-containing protein